MTLLDDKQYTEYFKPILAAINTTIDMMLNRIDELELIKEKYTPPEAISVDELKELVNTYEELKKAFIKREMDPMQEARLVIILNQTRSNLKINRQLLDKSIAKMDMLIQICENAQINQSNS